MKDIEEITEVIECIHSQLKDTNSLCRVVWEKIDHADGEKPLMTYTEYDTLRDLISILFERIYDETTELNDLIKRIYDDKREAKNGEV